MSDPVTPHPQPDRPVRDGLFVIFEPIIAYCYAVYCVLQPKVLTNNIEVGKIRTAELIKIMLASLTIYSLVAYFVFPYPVFNITNAPFLNDVLMLVFWVLIPNLIGSTGFHLALKLVGGKATLRQTVLTYGYLSTVILMPLVILRHAVDSPTLQNLIGQFNFVFFLYGVVVLAKIHKITSSRAALAGLMFTAVALPCALLFMMVFLKIPIPFLGGANR